MRKIISFLTGGVVILSQFQALPLYAQSLFELEEEKKKGVETLQAVEQIVDSAVDKIDSKIKNQSKKEKLQEKNEEIKEYLDEVSQDISNEKQTTDIKEKVEEARKVVVLKVVSGVTEYEDAADNISSDVADTPREKKAALEAIQDTLETKSGDYSIIVRSSYSRSKVQDLFGTFDEATDVRKMYEIDGENYFEVFLEEDSIFRQEMLEDIELGILPESFLGVEIVLPEVFSIGEISLEGENISQIWGIEEYQTYRYFGDIEGKNTKVRVGVVDTGIDYNHPDLAQSVNRDLGKDFVNEDDDAWDDQGHGTHVAGTIAANINGQGIIGVNPYVELVPLKICTEQGFCPSYAVLRALEYAEEEGIDILNMSLGGRAQVQDHPICDGISAYKNSGGIVVVAAGNANIDTSLFVPGGCEDTITVAALDSNDLKASFSNFGTKVDIAAPGVGVYSTYPMNKGEYKKLSGTSMATPHIVGIVSIIQSYNPLISLEELEDILDEYSYSTQYDSSFKRLNIDTLMLSLMTEMQSEQVSDEVPEEDISIESVSEETIHHEEVSQNPQDEISMDGRYEILLDSIIYVEEEIQFIPNQEERDETVIEANRELVSQSITELPEIYLEPSSVLLDIFDNEGIDVNTVFTGSVETGSITPESVQEKSISQEIPDTQIFSETGDAISETEINSIDKSDIRVTGEVLGDDIDIYNLPERSSFSKSDTIVINSIEIPEVQEIFIDGSEKNIQIHSNGEINELIFSTGSIKEVEIYGDEFGEPEDVIIEDFPSDFEFHTNTPIYLDGVEQDIEINSLDDGETGELLEIQEWSEDIIVPRYEEDNELEGETFTPIEMTQESFDSEGIEINNTGGGDSEPPITQTISMYIGQSTSSWAYGVPNYDATTSNTDIVSFSHSPYHFLFTGNQVGNTEVYLRDGDTVKYIFYVEVMGPPDPTEHSIDLWEGEFIRVYVDRSNYTIYKLPGSTGESSVSYNSRRNYFDIRGRFEGLQTYHMFDSRGFHMHTFEVNVKMIEPTIHEISMYEGESYYDGMNNPQNIYVSDPEIIQINGSSSGRSMIGLQAGYVEVLIRFSGENHLYRINVKEVPAPQEYNISTTIYQETDIHLPENIESYTQYYSGDIELLDEVSYIGNTMKIKTEKVGEGTITVKNSDDYTIYILNISSEPSYRSYTLHETDYIDVMINDNYDFHEDDNSIVRYTIEDDDGYLYGQSVGQTQVEVSHYSNGLQEVWDVEVLPKPEPIEIVCETQVGQDCILRVQNGGYYYETDIDYGEYNIDSWRDRFEFRSKKSGEYTAYIRSYYGNYITHIFRITVLPDQAEVIDCDIALGGICDLGRIYSNNRTLTFEETNPGLVNVLYSREAGNDITYKDSEYDEHGGYNHGYDSINQYYIYKLEYSLETLKEGRGDIYIYDNGYHLYTIRINSFSVDPIVIEDITLQVKQGELIKTQILDGGGDYREYDVHSSTGATVEIDYFDTDSDRDEDGFFLPTGEVKFRHSVPGNYYPIVADRYNQTEQLSVTVQDATLILSSYIPPDLQVGDWYNIQVLDRYLRVVDVNQTQGQEILQAYYVKDTQNDEEYIRIKALEAGETTLKAIDEEGNIATIDVIVSGVDEDTLEINNIIYTNTLGFEDIGGIYFETSGDYDEVGVRFINELGLEENYILDKQEDKKYIIGFSQISCSLCNQFIPYLKKDGQEYRFNSPYLISYHEGSYFTVTSGVSVSSYSYTEFLSRIRLAWHWGGYESAYNQAQTKIVDLKDNYGDPASLVISIIPIVGEGYDVITLIDGKDPITREELGPLAKSLTFLGLASGAGSGKAARDLGDQALQELADKLGMTIDEVTQIATEVIGEYKITSIQDIIDLKDKLKLDTFIGKVQGKALIVKFANIQIKLSDDALKHIKDRHLIDGELYIPGTTSYFFENQNIANLIDIFDTNGVEIAKNGKYSITKSLNNDIGFDRDIGENTNIMTIIITEAGDIITAHPGLPTK